MEISLDLNLVHVPKTITEYLADVSRIKDGGEKLSKIEAFVKRLEDEMRKIDAFKRELPLCMLLLNDAIVRFKEEAILCKERNDRGGEDGGIMDVENDVSEDKKSWMSSVQLWSNNNNNISRCKEDLKSEQKQRSEEDDDRSTCENPIQLFNHQNKGGSGGGALVTFNKGLSGSGFEGSERKEEKEVVSQVTGLSLMTPGFELGTCKLTSKGNGACNQMKIQNKLPPHQHQHVQQQQQQQQSFRKQRRCWSPELHRRFVDALQQLGGSQAATPKQIRELMQVDGLTNDEVKSHLQKYRLHIRKLPASSTATANSSWMNPDHCKDDPKQKSMQSNSPQGPLHGSGIAKDMSSIGGDSVEAEEDEKSESHSWNGGLFT